MANPGEILVQVYRSAVNSVLPNQLIRSSIEFKFPAILEIFDKRSDHQHNINLADASIFLFGAGKAVAGMCQEFLERVDLYHATLSDHRKFPALEILGGHLNVPFGSRIENPGLFLKYNTGIFRCGRNNIPDEHSVVNTGKMLETMRIYSMTYQYPVFIGFISGGGSALLSQPIPSISIEEKQQLINKLVAKGANITELNTVRSCLSQVKQGKLAKQLFEWNPNCRILTFIISDIIGDPIGMIASGPTVIEHEQALKPEDVLRKYSIKLDKKLIKCIIKNITKASNVSTKIDGSKILNLIIGNNSIALDSARKTAEENGLKVIMVGSNVSGEASLVVKNLVEMVINYQVSDEDLRCYKGVVWLAGGETTITMDGKIGLGGRCQEMGLLFLDELHKIQYSMNKEIFGLFAGTDGQDGPTPVAGVHFKWPPTQFNEDHDVVWQHLKNAINHHDSYSFWSKYTDNECLIRTGITGTNVMDIYCVMIPIKH